MPRLIAFLRAVNVGGRLVPMPKLRQEFEALGFTRVETFIASGNVIFTARSADARAIAKRIEARVRAAFGFEVATFIRTDVEVAAIAGYQAFSAARIKSAGAFCVALLEQPPDAAGTRALMALKTDIDDFHCNGREVYWLCRKKQSDSTFSNASLEKALKIRATLRGISTIARLSAKHGPDGVRS
ncbi:MAG: uncharacterized protein JWL71_4065 [Acidobacteria bacterium]|nr:uncharacterized protein [Acidobacteriota bacterium]